MFAMFFFLALYMQNILGYSPLETGVRFLPIDAGDHGRRAVAGRLADRIGPRTLLVDRAAPGHGLARLAVADRGRHELRFLLGRSSCSASAWAR